MITKTEFCMDVLIKEAKELNKSIKDLKENDIMQSSSLAVVMEYFGLLHDPELIQYVSTRGGMFLMTETCGMLSTREMLEILPDENEEEFRFLQRETIDEFQALFESLTNKTYEVYLKDGKNEGLKKIWAKFRSQRLEKFFN
jgi:hypothetical protein